MIALIDSNVTQAPGNLTDLKEHPPAIKSKYKKTSLDLIVDSPTEDKESVHIEGTVNPSGKGPEHDDRDKPFEVVEVTAPNGAQIRCAKRGSALVPLGKVEIYAMGKVQMYPEEELRQLREMKQNNRKAFDKDPKNEERLQHISEVLKHNYERSQEMFETIKTIGFVDSVEHVNEIITHVLSVGEEVTVEGEWQTSELKGPSGAGIAVSSMWRTLPDGTRYLATIRFMPKGRGDET